MNLARIVCLGPDQSNSYGEFMTLFSKTVAERTKPGQRQDIEEQGMNKPNSGSRKAADKL